MDEVREVAETLCGRPSRFTPVTNTDGEFPEATDQPESGQDGESRERGSPG